MATKTECKYFRFILAVVHSWPLFAGTVVAIKSVYAACRANTPQKSLKTWHFAFIIVCNAVQRDTFYYKK